MELRTDKQTQEEPVTCEQDTQTIRSTTKSADCSANPILDCEDSNHWLVSEAENISVQDDSECEYDFILHDNNTSTQNEMIPPQQG